MSEQEYRIEREFLATYATDVVRDAAYIFMVSYQKMSVADFQNLRGKLRDAQASCRVLKNSYIKLGLTQNNVALPADFSLTGDTALVFGQGDPVTVAKALRDFAKEKEQVQVKGGVLEQNYVNADAAKAMADMPSKEQLYAEIVFAIQSPARKVHQMISGNRNRVVHILQQYIHQKESE